MRVKALLTGINLYPKSIGQLGGCVQDVRNMGAFLAALYPGIEIRTLLDKEATYEAIAAGREWLAADAPNIAFDMYSGHGTTGDDVNHDETKYKQDQMTVPVDGALIADDRNGYWASLMSPDTLLVQHYDCCFAQGGERLTANTGTYRSRFVPYEQISCLRKAKTKYLLDKIPTYKSKANHIFIATSQFDTTAADAFIDNKQQGAGTWAILQVLKAHPDFTYAQISDAANDLLDDRFSQRVSVWAGEPSLLQRKSYG